MEHLPDDIVLNILSKLPTMEFSGLKCVCKSWKKMVEMILNQPALIRLLRDSPSICNSMDNLVLVMRDDDDRRDMFCTYLAHCKTRGFRQKVLISKNMVGSSFEIVGSCNGLLCLMDGTRSRIIVMNPLTSQTMWLPNLDFIRLPKRVAAFGFGYNSTTDSYKVMVLIRDNYSHSNSDTVMFDCETNNGWRSVRYHPFWNHFRISNSGIFLNGRLHWITEREIVSFDLTKETFTSMLLPIDLWSSRFRDLIVFQGCLCVVKHLKYLGTMRLQIWVMKKYGVEKSWGTVDDYSEPIIGRGRMCFKALGEVEDGKILVKSDETMLLYDPMSKKFKSLEYQRLPRMSTPIIHFPTLDWPCFYRALL